jgi:hypothetical protein
MYKNNSQVLNVDYENTPHVYSKRTLDAIESQQIANSKSAQAMYNKSMPRRAKTEKPQNLNTYPSKEVKERLLKKINEDIYDEDDEMNYSVPQNANLTTDGNIQYQNQYIDTSNLGRNFNQSLQYKVPINTYGQMGARRSHDYKKKRPKKVFALYNMEDEWDIDTKPERQPRDKTPKQSNCIYSLIFRSHEIT